VAFIKAVVTIAFQTTLYPTSQVFLILFRLFASMTNFSFWNRVRENWDL